MATIGCIRATGEAPEGCGEMEQGMNRVDESSRLQQ
jgi:hypothetical protein